MLRKNITGLDPKDLLCKWKYERDGVDVFDIHSAINYRQTERPLGTLRLHRGSDQAEVEWADQPATATA